MDRSLGKRRTRLGRGAAATRGWRWGRGAPPALQGGWAPGDASRTPGPQVQEVGPAQQTDALPKPRHQRGCPRRPGGKAEKQEHRAEGARGGAPTPLPGAAPPQHPRQPPGPGRVLTWTEVQRAPGMQGARQVPPSRHDRCSPQLSKLLRRARREGPAGSGGHGVRTNQLPRPAGPSAGQSAGPSAACAKGEAGPNPPTQSRWGVVFSFSRNWGSRRELNLMSFPPRLPKWGHSEENLRQDFFCCNCHLCPRQAAFRVRVKGPRLPIRQHRRCTHSSVGDGLPFTELNKGKVKQGIQKGHL